MVEGPGPLEAVDRRLTFGEDCTGIVQKDIEPWISIAKFPGEPPHLGLGRQVGDQKIDLRVPGLGGDRGRCLARARLVPPGNDDMRAHSRESQRAFPADAERSAGHQAHFVLHFQRHATSSRLAQASFLRR